MGHIYNTQIENLPLEALRNLQSERLVKQVRMLYDKVPFYQKKFDALGLQPGDIKGIDDIDKLPVTHKKDLRDNYPFGLFNMPVSDLARVHCSSGTTGKPTVVGYSDADIELWAECVARSLVAAGAKPGMLLHCAYGYGLFTGGLGLHYGAEKLGMTVVPISGGMTDRQLTLLQDFKPDVICCTPSYAQTLAYERNRQKLPPFNVKYAILGAEPWNEVIRKDIEDGLEVCATNIYGLSEIIGPGVSQEDYEEKGTGSYIWEDHFFPEILNPDTLKPVSEGEQGVLSFTNLTKSGMALLRYITNDITSLTYKYSEKRTHVKMGPILGRADDMLIIRGVNFFPGQVEEIVTTSPELSPTYFLTIDKKGAMDHVTVEVESIQGVSFSDEKKSSIASNVGAKVKNNVGITVEVVVRDYGSMNRSDGGKVQKVKDNRAK